MVVASVLVRVLFMVWGEISAPFGEDAEFWGYRAVELRHGILVGSHPPFFPLLSLIAGAVPGVDLAHGAWAVAILSGILSAPAMAFGMAAVGGRKAGLVAGWATLLLPNLVAWSLRVEPSSLFVLLLALCLFLAGRVAYQRSVAHAAALGLVVFLLGLTKESGFVYLVPLGLGAVIAARRRWLPILLAIGLSFTALYVPFRMMDEAGGASLTAKASLPFTDMGELLTKGRVPPPVESKDDRAIAPTAATLTELRAPETTPRRRAELVAVLQGRRLVRFCGLWLVIVPVAIVGAVRAWRRGDLPLWQLVLGVGSSSLLGSALLVIVQPRHAEAALFGGLWTVSLCLPRWWERGGRRTRGLLATVGLGLALQSAYLLREVEAPRAWRLEQQSVEAARTVAWAEDALPEGGVLSRRPTGWGSTPRR